MISTHSFETLRDYNLRFSTVLRPFGVSTHVETVVCLSREKADDYVRISVCTKDLKVTKES